MEECGIGNAKMDESIELLFRVVSVVGLRNHAQWRHLVNTVERLCATVMSESATRGGDAAYCQMGNALTLLLGHREEHPAFFGNQFRLLTSECNSLSHMWLSW